MPRDLLDAELRATVECRLVTVGRKTGEPREIRIWFSSVDDRVFVLAQDRERAHWVRNVGADPQVRVRIGARSFEGRARVIDPADTDDRLARDTWAEKYGTKYFEKFLREALPVAIDLEREAT